jgi:hypothetical protein
MNCNSYEPLNLIYGCSFMNTKSCSTPGMYIFIVLLIELSWTAAQKDITDQWCDGQNYKNFVFVPWKTEPGLKLFSFTVILWRHCFMLCTSILLLLTWNRKNIYSYYSYTINDSTAIWLNIEQTNSFLIVHWSWRNGIVHGTVVVRIYIYASYSRGN